MKKIVLFLLPVLIVAVFSKAGIAGVFYQNCQMCHGLDKKSSVAKLTKSGLMKKYKTKDRLVAGARAAKDSDMEPIRDDVELLKDAADDLGLK
jgi:mono/diheme cytochrome c family protein